MAFPVIQQFRKPLPAAGPYEEEMGKRISALLTLFRQLSPDRESNAHVSELLANPSCWSAGHQVFDEVRNRLLACQQLDQVCASQAAQYNFEEACCQAAYNADEPDDPFDIAAPFYVVSAAIWLAHCLGIPMEEVARAIVPDLADRHFCKGQAR
jgi:hypothetical protein